MDEITLTRDDEQLRTSCENEAAKHWPGARVLVHEVSGQYQAAVHLPEDGVSLETSAESSELQSSARDALDEVMRVIKAQVTARPT